MKIVKTINDRNSHSCAESHAALTSLSPLVDRANHHRYHRNCTRWSVAAPLLKWNIRSFATDQRRNIYSYAALHPVQTAICREFDPTHYQQCPNCASGSAVAVSMLIETINFVPALRANAHLYVAPNQAPRVSCPEVDPAHCQQYLHYTSSSHAVMSLNVER